MYSASTPVYYNFSDITCNIFALYFFQLGFNFCMKTFMTVTTRTANDNAPYNITTRNILAEFLAISVFCLMIPTLECLTTKRTFYLSHLVLGNSAAQAIKTHRTGLDDTMQTSWIAQPDPVLILLLSCDILRAMRPTTYYDSIV